MFNPDWLILCILHQSFEIERLKGHWSEVVVHLYVSSTGGVHKLYKITAKINSFNMLNYRLKATIKESMC